MSTLPTSNPFIINKYYIYESGLGVGQKSKIDTTIITSTGMTKNGPFNLIDVTKYIMVELRKFNKMFDFVKKCNINAQNILRYGYDKSAKMDEECMNTFTAFKDINQKLLSAEQQNVNSWKDIFKDGITIIGPKGENMFDKLTYSPAYINSVSGNDKKSMSQRLGDLTNLIQNLNVIIETIVNDGYSAQNYKDEYTNIQGLIKQIEYTRRDLDSKLLELKSGNGSKYGNSKLYLDSTVYTSILWTILATTLIFYVFKKL